MEEQTEINIGAETDIRDIKAPVNLPVNYNKIIAAVVVTLLIIAGLIIGFIFFVNRKKNPMSIYQTRLPHEIAYEQLEIIKQDDLIGRGFVEEYYVRLSDTARHYLENRFGLRAPEMTSEEFLQAASVYSDFKDSIRGLLKDFMAHCDLVKFACYGPDEKEMKAAFYSAKQLVDDTRESEEEEVEE